MGGDAAGAREGSSGRVVYQMHPSGQKSRVREWEGTLLPCAPPLSLVSRLLHRHCHAASGLEGRVTSLERCPGDGLPPNVQAGATRIRLAGRAGAEGRCVDPGREHAAAASAAC